MTKEEEQELEALRAFKEDVAARLAPLVDVSSQALSLSLVERRGIEEDAYTKGYVDGLKHGSTSTYSAEHGRRMAKADLGTRDRALAHAYDMQAMVREFHDKCEHPTPHEPTIEGYRFELRAQLILEETLEFISACGLMVELDGRSVLRVPTIPTTKPDWPEMIDALCDLLYVTFGAAVEMGIPLLPFFREVHRSNMEKFGGPKRGDGKTLKPEGWKPPRIKEMLEAIIGKKL